MISDEEHLRLTVAFAEARAAALTYAARYNASLPVTACPQCDDGGHVPGLLCPACGYRHPVPWLILVDTEYGYELVSIARPRTTHAVFAAKGV